MRSSPITQPIDPLSRHELSAAQLFARVFFCGLLPFPPTILLLLAPLRFACQLTLSTTIIFTASPAVFILCIATLLIFFVHGYQSTLLFARVCFFVAPDLRDVADLL